MGYLLQSPWELFLFHATQYPTTPVYECTCFMVMHAPKLLSC
jgi:hypothetical protein